MEVGDSVSLETEYGKIVVAQITKIQPDGTLNLVIHRRDGTSQFYNRIKERPNMPNPRTPYWEKTGKKTKKSKPKPPTTDTETVTGGTNTDTTTASTGIVSKITNIIKKK